MNKYTRFCVAFFLLVLFLTPTISFAFDAPHVAPAAQQQGAMNVAKSAASKSQVVAADQITTGAGVDAAGYAIPTIAPPLYGASLSTVLISDNPDSAHTYRAVIWWQPKALVFKRASLYFAASFGHWWSQGAPVYRALNIYAVAPVVRFYIKRWKYFSPYLEASVGPGYLTRTQFANRNLGEHFTFQDEAGIGAVAGESDGFYATLSVLHYSNGAFCDHNSGITMPLMLNVGYQFN